MRRFLTRLDSPAGRSTDVGADRHAQTKSEREQSRSSVWCDDALVSVFLHSLSLLPIACMSSLFRHFDRSHASEKNENDFSAELKAYPFASSFVASLSIKGDISALAYDPVQSLLAVGTKHGLLYVFGAPAVALSFGPKPASSIKLLAFKPGTALLLAIDGKDTLYIYDLADVHLNPTTHVQEPQRHSVHSLRSVATCLEVSAVHAHSFIGFRDGSVDCYDTVCSLSPCETASDMVLGSSSD